MIKINLLPPALRPSRWSFFRIAAVATLVAMLSFAGITGYNLLTIRNLERELTELERQARLLQPTRSNMLMVLNGQQELKEKINTAAQIAIEHRSWYGVVAYVGLVTPAQIGLTEVLANDPKKLLLRGTAESHGDLASFIQRLEQDGFFERPVLLKVENDGLQEVTTFELSVTLKEI